LIWTSITILVSLAVIKCGQAIGWAPGMTGLVHDPWLIVSATASVTIFMLLGFYRAAEEVRSLNSEFAYGKSISEVAEAARERAALVGKLNAESRSLSELLSTVEKERKEKLHRLIRGIESHARDTISFGDDFVSAQRSQMSHLEDQRAAEARLEAAASGSGAFQSYKQDVNRARRKARQYEDMRDRYRSEIERSIEKAKQASAEINSVCADLPPEASEQPKMDKEWSDLSDQLQTLSNAIGNSGRFWLTWYDVRPVWILGGIALLLAFVRLVWPWLIPNLLGYSNLVVTANGCVI